MQLVPIPSANDLFAFFKKKGVLGRYGLQAVGVFGSLARGGQFNDIDLLIEDDVSYDTLIDLKLYLEKKTGYKVDIIQSKYAEPLIFNRALSEVKRCAA